MLVGRIGVVIHFTLVNLPFFSVYHVSALIFFPSTFTVFTVLTFPSESYSEHTIQLPVVDFAFEFFPIATAIEFFPDVAAWL